MSQLLYVAQTKSVLYAVDIQSNTFLPSNTEISRFLDCGLLLALYLQDIISFIFYPVINEGLRIVEEGIVSRMSDLDVLW